MIDPHDLVPGEMYDVTIQDCCVEGKLRGRFVALVNPGFSDGSGDPERDFDAAMFDFGSLSGNGWQVTAQGDKRVTC